MITVKQKGPWRLTCLNCGQSEDLSDTEKDYRLKVINDNNGIYCCSAPGIDPMIRPLFKIKAVELSPFLQELQDRRMVELSTRREMLAKARDQINNWNKYKTLIFQHIDQLTPVFKDIVRHSVFNLNQSDKVIREGSKLSSNLFWRLKIVSDNQFLHIGLGQTNVTINGKIEIKSLQRINGLITEYPWNSTRQSFTTKEEEMLLDKEFLPSIRSFQRQVETLTNQLDRARVVIILGTQIRNSNTPSVSLSRTFLLQLDNFLKCDIVKTIEQLTLFLLTATIDVWEGMTKDMYWDLIVTSDKYKFDSDIEPLPENMQLALDSNILDERVFCIDCGQALNLTHLNRCNTCQSERNLQIRRWFKNQMLADSQIHAILELLNKLDLNIED